MNKIILILITVFACSAYSETIKTIGPQSRHEVSHGYFVGILLEAFRHAKVDHTLKVIPHQTEARDLKLLKETELIDIVWTANSTSRDNELFKIPFPLFLGGLGIRGAVVHKDFLHEFEQLTSLDKLKNYIACQGQHWPDAIKLEKAGLKVYRATRFDSMLEMIDRKRCDYLPLSIFEGKGELDAVKEQYPNLVFSTKVLLSYELQMSYYVKRSANQLADEVLRGLKAMEESGDFLKYMRNSRLTEQAFPLSQFSDSIVINIDGSKSTRIVDEFKKK